MTPSANAGSKENTAKPFHGSLFGVLVQLLLLAPTLSFKQNQLIRMKLFSLDPIQVLIWTTAALVLKIS